MEAINPIDDILKQFHIDRSQLVRKGLSDTYLLLQVNMTPQEAKQLLIGRRYDPYPQFFRSQKGNLYDLTRGV